MTGPEPAPRTGAATLPAAQGTRLRWRERMLAAAGGRLLDALMASCRYRMEGEANFRRFWDRGEPVIFVLWHGRLLPCTYYQRHAGLVTLVSRHRDGEYIARAVRRWGYVPVRGSSSRGGPRALRELVRHVEAGRSLAITPDGPRGPREVMKPGPVVIAQRTGAPLIPVAAGAASAWYFGGWDRFLVPRPFTRLRIACGEPVFVPKDADDAEVGACCREVERRLGEVMARVDEPRGSA